MGKTLTRTIGAGFALALAGATFSPAIANAQDEGEVGVPRVVTISDAADHDNGFAEISIVADTDDEGDFTESLEITLTNTAVANVDDPEGWIDRHCYYYLNAAGDVPENLVEQYDAGDVEGNLLGSGWANNHGNQTMGEDVDTSDLEDGNYTVSSVCVEGDIGNGEDEVTELSGTQDFTLSTPTAGSLGDLTGSLGGDSLGGDSLGGDSLGGGSAGDTGSTAAVGSLVLGGAIAAGIHAHNTGMF